MASSLALSVLNVARSGVPPVGDLRTGMWMLDMSGGFSDILVGQVDLTGKDVLKPVDLIVIHHFVDGLGKFFSSILVKHMGGDMTIA